MARRAAPKLDPHEEHYWIPSPVAGLEIFLRRLPARRGVDGGVPVLYVHGATFPSALSIAHRFDGHSWRDALVGAGFDVWGMDFLGFGHSGRYPEMAAPAEAFPPLGRAEEASEQIAAAVRYVIRRTEAPRVSIIAHSWGTIAAGRFAAAHPALVDRLVFFGPIARRTSSALPQAAPAWRIVTLEEQWRRFVEDVPPGERPILSRRRFEDWGARYLDSDPESRSRAEIGVKVPAGPFADIARAWAGDLAYDPAAIEAPVAIIRGEWDSLASDADARWLFDALRSSSMRRDVKIGRATHLMHLEEMRFALHRESIVFLRGDDH
ncbi:MAG: alpha/beta fold hydrolase [Rhodospirillales bacterium]|nr:alpha/beta fold hydrolase [Rhodospirillales bacterium]